MRAVSFRWVRSAAAPRAALALVACGSLMGCGSGSSASPSTPQAPGGGGGAPAVTGASWGFFSYTTDFVGGLSNARWARATGILWPQVERPPGSGQYDWSGLDAMVQSAQAARLNGVLELKTGNGPLVSDPGCLDRVRSAPDDAFSNGKGLSSCPIKPDMESAWAAMVTAVVERYDGDGVADMPGWNGSVRVDIQVENEPANWELWDFGQTDRTLAADHYLRLLEISYPAKQAAAPGTQLILAGLIHPNILARCDAEPGLPLCGALAVQWNMDFTRRVLARPALFDAVDVHVFQYYHFEPSYIDDGFAWLTRQMQQLGYQRPIYCLEWTGSSMLHVWLEGHADEFSAYFPFSSQFPDPASFLAMYQELDGPANVAYRKWFEAEQAKEFGKLFTNMLAAGASRLVHVQYTDLWAGSPWNNVWWNWQGVIKYAGSAPIRKPSYYTYNLLAERLSGFGTVRRVGPAGEVRLYEFTFASGEPAYVLWTDGPGVTLDLSSITSHRSVRLTRLVTELDAANGAVVLPDETVSATAVPAGDVPVLLRGVD